MVDGLHFQVAIHPAYRAVSDGFFTRYRLYLVDGALCPIILVDILRNGVDRFQLFFSLYDERGRYVLVEWDEDTARECAGKEVETFES
jgi:hypothetical protein